MFYHHLYSQNDEEDNFKRDFSEPTLEDHFDKTVLPKVMQVSDSSSQVYTSVMYHLFTIYLISVYLLLKFLNRCIQETQLRLVM